MVSVLTYWVGLVAEGEPLPASLLMYGGHNHCTSVRDEQKQLKFEKQNGFKLSVWNQRERERERGGGGGGGDHMQYGEYGRAYGVRKIPYRLEFQELGVV